MDGTKAKYEHTIYAKATRTKNIVWQENHSTIAECSDSIITKQSACKMWLTFVNFKPIELEEPKASMYNAYML